MCAQAVHIFGYEHVLRVDLWCSLGVTVPSIFRRFFLCNERRDDVLICNRKPPALLASGCCLEADWQLTARRSASLDDVELYVAACEPPPESQ